MIYLKLKKHKFSLLIVYESTKVKIKEPIFSFYLSVCQFQNTILHIYSGMWVSKNKSAVVVVMF